MKLNNLKSRIKNDTRVDELFDDFLIETYKGKVKIVETRGNSKKKIQKAIEREKKEPSVPVRISFITDDGELQKDTAVLTELGQDILDLPYIQDIHRKESGAILSKRYESDKGTVHEGIYTVIDHWIE
jgi:hypothetical protein